MKRFIILLSALLFSFDSGASLKDDKQTIQKAALRGVVATGEWPVEKLALQASVSGDSLRRTVRELHKKGGVGAFWRGNSINLLRAARWAPRLQVIAKTPKFFKKHHITPTSAVMGITLGALDSALYPIERVRTLYATEGKNFSFMKEKWAARKLYTGVKPFFLGNSLHWMAFLYVKSKSRQLVRSISSSRPSSLKEGIYTGVLTGGVNVGITAFLSPLRVLVANEQKRVPLKSKNIFHGIRHIYSTKGLTPFYSMGSVSVVMTIVSTLFTVMLMPHD